MKELEASAETKNRANSQRVSKEETRSYGVKLARCMKKLTSTGDRAIFCARKKFLFCKELFRSDYMEEALLASFRFPNYVERLEPSNLAVLKFWIERYMNKWLKFDTFCKITSVL